MSKKSEYVKTWRKNFKKRIIKAMGGRCVICGYNNCDNALACHHLDPTKKDFTIGSKRKNPSNWPSVVEELRKCVLLCHNCHVELHDGVAKLPEEFPLFDEKYSNYKVLLEEVSFETRRRYVTIFDECPVCKEPKFPKQITCSVVCAAKRRNVTDWNDSRLLEQLKTRSRSKVAEELGVSEGAVRKRLNRIDKLGINSPAKNSGETFITNCFGCNKELKRFASSRTRLMFCSKKCHYDYSNKEWPNEEELLKMKESMSVEQISKELNKGKSVIYQKIRKIKHRTSL